MILKNALDKASPALKAAAEELAAAVNPSNDPEGIHLYRVVHVSDTSFEAVAYQQLGNQVFDWGRFKIPDSLLYRGNGLFVLNSPAKKEVGK